MIVELINTGSELMLGRVLNTHQQWLCRQLADLGYVVSRQVAVPDTGSDIEQAVREALGRQKGQTVDWSQQIPLSETVWGCFLMAFSV